MSTRAWTWSAALALLVLILAFSIAPLFWMRWFAPLFFDSTDAPLWFYTPRVKVQGAQSSGPPHVAPELQQLEASALRAAADYAAHHRSRALIVSRRSHLILEKYWDTVDPAALDNSGRLSAPLAAVMLGIAMDDAKVGSLEEPASSYLQEWRNGGQGQIRVRELLQNSDPQTLALVIERATGEPYARYVSEKLWRRIGASDAYLWLDRAKGTARADCCMLARPGDWMRVAEVLANDGVYLGEEIVRPGRVRQMFASSAPQSYAVNDMLVLGGGRYRLWISPSLKLSILRVGAGHDGDDWSDTQIPNLIIHGLSDFVPPAASPARTVDPANYAPGH